MKTGRICLAITLACGAFAASSAFAAKPLDKEMVALATTSGCVACHSLESPAKPRPDGLAPIGPNWPDVAEKYRGQGDAVDKLTRAVLNGSNPYESHWKGKVSGLSMPPNAVAIKEADAKKLVKWILSLSK